LSQRTEAVCNITSLAWSFNSIGQSPCLVAAYLSNPCSTNGNFDVPNIGPGLHYTPPDEPSLCTCSTVVYSLLGACAACQEADVGVWSEFSVNCTQSSPDGQYGFAIPSGTAVPKWAYQMVVGANRFNLSLAKSVGDLPENVTAPATTSTPAPSSTTPIAGDLNPTSSSSSSPGTLPAQTSKSSGKNNTGVIAGSVVGGVVGVALIGGLLAFCLISQSRKKQSEPAPSVGYFSNYERPVSHYTAVSSPGPTRSEFGAPPTPLSGYNTQPLLSHQQQLPTPSGSAFDRPYNPDDPSTFPLPRPGPGTKQTGLLFDAILEGKELNKKASMYLPRYYFVPK